MSFLVVYILEAHPSDVWQMQSNIKDKVVFASPKNEEERIFIAGACVRKLGIKIPAVLDEFGNSPARDSTARPPSTGCVVKMRTTRSRQRCPFPRRQRANTAVFARKTGPDAWHRACHRRVG